MRNLILKSLLFPKEKTLNLSIHQNSLRFILSKGEKIFCQSILELKEDILEEGKIKNKEVFLEVLRKLSSLVRKKGNIGKNELIPVLISIPDNQVYYQHLEIPTLNKKELKEAISLNLIMNSPFEKESFYSDWQVIKKDEIENSLKIFAAFIRKDYIDSLEKLFKQAGFKIKIIETHSISLNRLLRESLKNYQNYNWLNLYLTRKGIDVFFSAGGNLILAFFVDWLSKMEDLDTEKAIILLEKNISQITNRILNHYQKFLSGKKEISSIFLEGDNILLSKIRRISQNLEKRINIPVRVLFANSPLNVCYGLYMRELFSEKYSQDITLTSLSALEEFQLESGKRFANYWSKIFFTLITGLISLSLLSLFFMKKSEKFLTSQSVISSNPQRIRLFNELKREAEEFNFSLDRLIRVKKETNYLARPLDELFEISRKNNVQINKLYFDGLDKAVRLIGKARKMDYIANFKSELKENNSLYENVSFLTNSLKKIGDELIFEIDFQIKK